VAVAGPIGKSTTRRMIEHLADTKNEISQASGTREGAASPYDVLLALTELTTQPVAVIECGGSDELQLCDHVKTSAALPFDALIAPAEPEI
jgi:hypothetical protein